MSHTLIITQSSTGSVRLVLKYKDIDSYKLELFPSRLTKTSINNEDNLAKAFGDASITSANDRVTVLSIKPLFTLKLHQDFIKLTGVNQKKLPINFTINAPNCKIDAVNALGMSFTGKVELYNTNIIESLISDEQIVNHGKLLTHQVVLKKELLNLGEWNHSGALSAAGKITNQGAITFNKVSGARLSMDNKKDLSLKDSSIGFTVLFNASNAIFISGNYEIKSLTNTGILSFIDNHWGIFNYDYYTDREDGKFTWAFDDLDNYLKLAKDAIIGQIEHNSTLIYAVAKLPNSLISMGSVDLGTKYPRKLSDLTNITAKSLTFKLAEKDIATPIELNTFGQITINVPGDLIISNILKTPALTLVIRGKLICTGSIAATNGQLNITATEIDASKGKIFGKGKSIITATTGKILVGSSAPGMCPKTKNDYYGAVTGTWWWSLAAVQNAWAVCSASSGNLNGAYIASDNTVTLNANEIGIECGAVVSINGTSLMAKTTTNTAGKIVSGGSITVSGETYTHTVKAMSAGSWSGGNGSWCQCPTSGPALLETLDSITFNVKTVTNRASTIRSGKKFVMGNGGNYLEEPVSYSVRYHNDYGRGCDWGWKQYVVFSQNCTVQTGNKIEINATEFRITGKVNSPVIEIKAKTAQFINNSTDRTDMPTDETLFVNLTEFMRNQATTLDLINLNTVPQQWNSNRLILGNRQLPLHQSFIDPLFGVPKTYINLALQNIMGEVGGKIMSLVTEDKLWDNNTIKSKEELKTLTKAMLIHQLQDNPSTSSPGEVVDTLLCLPLSQRNPYTSNGDISGDTFFCETESDQYHHNNRIVTHEKIELTSTKGNIDLKTNKYSVVSANTTQELAMPQQQLVSGNVIVNAAKDLTRVGTLVASKNTAQLGANTIREDPLILRTVVHTEEKKSGLFGTSTTTEVKTTHTLLSNTTVSGSDIMKTGTLAITQQASKDIAPQSITYDAPTINIAGVILANRTEKSGSTDKLFSNSFTTNSTESAVTFPAVVSSKEVIVKGTTATIAGTIVKAETVVDYTIMGIKFIPTVIELLCSSQMINDSAFMHMDIGFKAGREQMLPTMLEIQKIVRKCNSGEILLQSVQWDKNRTQIIGKWVESSYQLKSWQVSWSHVEQLIPDSVIVIIGLSISLLTQGMGVQVLSSLVGSLGTVGTVMVNAGFSAICSTAAMSFAKYGDPERVITDLTSTSNLKALGIAIASAGLCDKLSLSTPGSLLNHTAKQTIDALLHASISNESIETAMGKIPLKVIAGYISDKIYTNFNLPGLKLTAGAIAGFASEPNTNGIISGVIGSLTAETVGNFLLNDASAIAKQALNSTLDIDEAISKEVRYRANVTKISAAIIASLLQKNPGAAISSVHSSMETTAKLYALAEFRQLLIQSCKAISILGSINYVKSESDETNNSIKDGGKPFVRNPKAGIWNTGCISADLILTEGIRMEHYTHLRTKFTKDPKCPFTVVAHKMENSDEILIETTNLPPNGLSEFNRNLLKQNGKITLDMVQVAKLIKACPEYQGQHIHLFTCNGTPHLAQQLANQLKVSVSSFSGQAAMYDILGYASLNQIPDSDQILPPDTILFTSESRVDGVVEFNDIQTFNPEVLANPQPYLGM